MDESPQAKFSRAEYAGGARLQVDAWVYRDRILWYYEAEPQFHDGVSHRVEQTFVEFLEQGPPEFAQGTMQAGDFDAIRGLAGRGANHA